MNVLKKRLPVVPRAVLYERVAQIFKEVHRLVYCLLAFTVNFLP